MYASLAERLALTPLDWSAWFGEVMAENPALIIEHSRPVSMDGYNAASYQATVISFHQGGSSTAEHNLYIDLQASNDLENWDTIDTGGIQISDVGRTVKGLVVDIAFAHVRLQYRMWQTESDFGTDPSTCALTAGINLVAS